MKLAHRTFEREDYKVTSKYGKRVHPVTGVVTTHLGEDYGTNLQNWTIYALENGIVTASNSDATNGNYIWVEYPIEELKIFYCHLLERKVKKDDKVTHATILGLVGMSGRATGIHLHMGVQKKVNGKWTYFDHGNYDYPKKQQENGIWDNPLTLSLQKFLGTPQDGLITGQFINKHNQNILSIRRGIVGSLMVKALQTYLNKHYGAKLKVDGYLGRLTIMALQKAMGTVADGIISKDSLCVREMKSRLEEGWL